jgi:hypothetical protein
MPLVFLRGLSRRPDYIAPATWPMKPPLRLPADLARADTLGKAGYSTAGVFPGRIAWYDPVLEEESCVILRKTR